MLSTAMDQQVESFWWEKPTAASPGNACFIGESNQEKNSISSFAFTVRAATRCRAFSHAGEMIWNMMARVIVPQQPKCCLSIS